MALAFGYPGSRLNRLTKLIKDTNKAVNKSKRLSRELERACSQLHIINSSSAEFQTVLEIADMIGLIMYTACERLGFKKCAVYIDARATWFVCDKHIGKFMPAPILDMSPETFVDLDFKHTDRLLISPIDAVNNHYGTMIVESIDKPSSLSRASVRSLATLTDVSITRIETLNASTEHACLNERVNAAMKLHETAVQTLSAALLHTGILKDLIIENPNFAEQSIADCVFNHTSKVILCFNKTLNELNSFLQTINPESFQEDLESALLAHWQSLQADNIELKLNIHEKNWVLPKYINKALATICREALRNVVKHSNAKEVCVNLYLRDHLLEMSIVDNGRGIKANIDDNHPYHFGLDFMQRSAAEINGLLKIEASSGIGTKIKLEAPKIEA